MMVDDGPPREVSERVSERVLAYRMMCVEEERMRAQKAKPSLVVCVCVCVLVCV